MVYPTCLCTRQTLEGEGVRNISFMIPFSTMTQSTTAYAICMRRLLPCEGIPSGKCCASLNTVAHLTHESSSLSREIRLNWKDSQVPFSLSLSSFHQGRSETEGAQQSGGRAEGAKGGRAWERAREGEEKRRRMAEGRITDGAAIGESAAFTV